MLASSIKKLCSIPLGLVAVLAIACSASDGDLERVPLPGASPGCGSGECSTCSTCLESCVCLTGGDPSCVETCGDVGEPEPPGGGVGGGAGSGAGATGSGATGGVSGAGSTGGASGSGATSGTGPGGSPGVGGASGSAGAPTGSGGASGTGAGGTGVGGAAGGTANPKHQEAITRAKSGIGFSYWWGHGRYRPEGPSSSIAGSCSGGCPDCTHSGSYGGDCSGFVAKVWQVPSSNTDLTVDSHPYSTADFYADTSQWRTVSQDTMQVADAMVYRSGGAGHIFIYERGDPWGSMYVYECKGCSYGCVAGMRTASSAYHSIRRAGY